MASVLPAMRGKFGSTEYYIVTMPAKELTERLVIPRDMEEWNDLSLEERYQREINYGRVKRQIVPYLAQDDDRFFGAFIVTMLHSDDTEFEPMTRIFGEKVPKLYKSAGSAFGFLTLEGTEVLVPLDGQHRLAALDFAITGRDEKNLPIKDLEPNIDIAEDICTVILVKHDPIKSRKIFNKVNRYAKKTSKADDLITADDDAIALIVRESVIGPNNIIPDVLVNAKSNTLTAKASEFTTLTTLYEGTKYLLEDTHGKIKTHILPDKAKMGVMRAEAVEFWEVLCSNIELFKDALFDPNEMGDRRRQEIRADFLIGKPVAQWTLVQAIVQLCEEDEATGHRKSLKEACQLVNRLDWSVSASRWQSVLMNGDKVMFGKSVVNFASQVITYWLGCDLDDLALSELRARYCSQGGKGQLADPIC
ncbi:MAG: DGQHR domain-containing protein [Acidimicrobiaceae bacterium]|nr:DGQHR domain-containing protein [Acidimicrobiaceae bacterium]MCY4280515.1 DGQHR domain-containing protein [Acidimicrobiaceae bacterium]MCY4293426.1 DGQHR domain-containing protein [Acidimicrobiaceae bacterium]